MGILYVLMNQSQHEINSLLEWTFPEYPHHQHSSKWYMWMGIIGGAFFFWSLVTQNYFFLVFLVLVFLVIFLHEIHPPQRITIRLLGNGIMFGAGDDTSKHHLYKYSDVRKFWILYEPPMVKNVYIVFRSKWKTRLRIPLEDQDPSTVRRILQEHCREDVEPRDEPLEDMLRRIIRL